MLISELFLSIDGEGKRAGELCTFVRTIGCNLKCGYCDSKYSWKPDETSGVMTIDEIVEQCEKFEVKNITLTGGEPLIQRDVNLLVSKLLENEFYVNIETNGSVDPYDVLSSECLTNKNLFFTIDYKCLSSGENKNMCVNAFKHMNHKDVLKCVVGSQEDMIDSVRFVNSIFNDGRNTPELYFSPVFGQIEPKEIVEFMKENDLQNWKVQLQLHKFIWNPNERGV